MEPKTQISAFVKDLYNIHKMMPYFDVETGGVFRYMIRSPGKWEARTNDFNIINVEIGKHLVVIGDEITVDGRKAELCWKSRCIHPSGIKVRLGAVVIAYYSFVDQMPISYISKRKMLYYVNNVEKEPDVAELGVKILAAKNTLGEAEEIVKMIVKEIGKIRLAKVVR